MYGNSSSTQFQKMLIGIIFRRQAERKRDAPLRQRRREHPMRRPQPRRVIIKHARINMRRHHRPGISQRLHRLDRRHRGLDIRHAVIYARQQMTVVVHPPPSRRYVARLLLPAKPSQPWQTHH